MHSRFAFIAATLAGSFAVYCVQDVVREDRSPDDMGPVSAADGAIPDVPYASDPPSDVFDTPDSAAGDLAQADTGEGDSCEVCPVRRVMLYDALLTPGEHRIAEVVIDLTDIRSAVAHLGAGCSSYELAYRNGLAGFIPVENAPVPGVDEFGAHPFCNRIFHLDPRLGTEVRITVHGVTGDEALTVVGSD